MQAANNHHRDALRLVKDLHQPRPAIYWSDLALTAAVGWGAFGVALMALILLIDDDPEIRAVLRRILRSAGHEIIEAEDGKSGLRQLMALEIENLLQTSRKSRLSAAGPPPIIAPPKR